MAEFSDMVRPGIDEHLSTLGHPDARLHLPRHHAIVSWSTPEGRQSPFVAETIPLRVDSERVALHAARQAERGGRYRTDLRQPHWDREHRSAAGQGSERPCGQDGERDDRKKQRESKETAEPHTDRAADTPQPPPERGEPKAPSDGPRVTTGTPPDSYRELVDLDGAHSVRWAKQVLEPRSLEPEALDLEILALVACMRHVLSSQIHRRFNPERATTTTQRRLKRLSDAGLVRRFQFHRRDGGGVPMCYAITAEGLELLHAHDRLTALEEGDGDMLRRPPVAGCAGGGRSAAAPGAPRRARGRLGAGAGACPGRCAADAARSPGVGAVTAAALDLGGAHGARAG